jgi:hypothetical protein
MIRQRAINKWPLLLIIALVICSIGPFRGLNTEANTPLFSIQVCRANVEPCQKEVSIPEGGTMDLDLILTAGTPNASSSPLQVVGWETHFRLSDNSVVDLMPDTVSGQPVREQGDPELALDSLLKLQDSGGEGSGEYFTVQNHFDGNSGRLDYSVTLVRFDQTSPQSRVLPFATNVRLHLGRITVKGVSKGSFDISPEAISNPFQVVTLDAPSDLSSVAAVASSTPQTTIRVGDVTTAELQGQIAPQGPLSNPLSGQFPTLLTVTFWPADAIPPWRGGNDLPLATFTRVVADATGAFRITDIALPLLPAGTYDLRIKSPRTLTSLASGVTMPSPGDAASSPPVVSISISSLRDGDIDGNNSIDQTDLNALKASFGRLESEPIFNTNTDFNGDGVVDVLDFARLAQNFGGRGD